MGTLQQILNSNTSVNIAWTLVHFIWQGFAIAIALAIVLKLTKKTSPSLRYIICLAAMCCIIAMPIITFSLMPDGINEIVAAPAEENITSPLPAMESAENIVTIPMSEFVPAATEAITPKVSMFEKFKSGFVSLVPYLTFFWLVGVVLLSVYYLGGFVQLQRMRRKFVKPVEGKALECFQRISRKFRIKKAVSLFESAMVQVPTVIGFFKPVILLPATALTGLSDDQLQAVLAHELAHIKRADYLINLIQTVVEILGFYHPAVWWISSKIRAQREHCCDDIAVAITSNSVDYAKALASMEQLRASSPTLAVAASDGPLLGRIKRLISNNDKQSRANWLPSLITISLIIALMIPIAFAMSSRPEIQKIDYSSVTVTEGVGFDDIVVGNPNCTTEFVISKLGKPQKQVKKGYTWLGYRKKYGLDFWFDSNNTLKEIRMNKRFKGKLSTGISLSSTMEEVFATYGEPIEEKLVDDLNERIGTELVNRQNQILYKNKSGIRKIYYHKNWLLFWFEGNKINQIVTFPKGTHSKSTPGVIDTETGIQIDIFSADEYFKILTTKYKSKNWQATNEAAIDFRDFFRRNNENIITELEGLENSEKITELVNTLEDLSDELHDSIRDKKLYLVPAFYEELSKKWVEFKNTILNVEKNIDISPLNFHVRIDPERSYADLVVSIQNNSNATIPKFKLRFYRSDPENNIDESGNKHITWHEAGPIEPGKQWNESTRDFHLPDGKYQFSVILDYDNKISELNENNNQANLEIEISNGKIIDTKMINSKQKAENKNFWKIAVPDYDKYRKIVDLKTGQIIRTPKKDELIEFIKDVNVPIILYDAIKDKGVIGFYGCKINHKKSKTQNEIYEVIKFKHKELPIEFTVNTFSGEKYFIELKSSDQYHCNIECFKIKEDVAPEKEKTIEVEAKFITFDPNAAINDSNGFKELLTQILNNKKNTLDKNESELFLKAVKSGAGNKILAAPKVAVKNKEEATVKISTTTMYVSGYNEPNDANPDYQPITETVYEDITFKALPEIRTFNNSQGIFLNLDLEKTEVPEWKEWAYNKKLTFKTPVIDTMHIKSNVFLEPGQTIVLAGVGAYSDGKETKVTNNF